MEYYKNMACVTFAELTEGEDPVIKARTLLVNVWRGNILRADRGGGEGTQALYVWSSLPDKYRRRFLERIGDPEKMIRKRMEEEDTKVREDAAARSWYEAYTYEDGEGRRRRLTDRKIAEYTANASALGALVKKLARMQPTRSSLGGRTAGTWQALLKTSEAMRAAYGHTLPSTPSRLRAKVNAYKERGYASLVSGRLGNANSVKITAEYGKLAIALKRSRTPVYTDRQLWERANEIAGAKGWKTVRSLSGLRRWLQSPAVQPLWYDAVHGEQPARQRYGRKHSTALPTRRDSLWYGDGTRLNLYYRDEGGDVRTVQVYEVVDAMSEVLLGYHISEREDYEAQYHAYRMAVQVSGHKPYEIVHDNQGGHKRLDSGGLLSRICRVHRTTQPYNGESKTIEAVFGRFQSQVLHKDWRFTGQNVTAKKATSRPNVEFVAANKDRLYTLDELKVAYAEARKEWNSMPHPVTGMSRMETYLASENDESPEVTPYDMVDMFWIFTKKPHTFTDQGITITVGGRKLRYEVFERPGVPDHAWRMTHTYARFIVAYDPWDTTSVRLYTQEADGALRFERTAEPYIVIHRALQDQVGTGDAEFIRREQAANLDDRMERTARGWAIAARHGMAPEQNGLSTPRLKGLTDEEQRQAERRRERYAGKPDPVEYGQYTKAVSMDDWRNLMEAGGEGDEDDGPRKKRRGRRTAAEKL